MKLSRIPGSEAAVKQSFAFKASTVARLQQYQACYNAEEGVNVAMKDMVEQMLNQFMDGDKDFQRFVRKTTGATKNDPNSVEADV